MLDGWNPDKHFQRRCALDALKGVGDASLGQWEEWAGRFYHVRRRLTAEEQASVGDALDIRGTPEAERRRAAVERFLPPHMRNWREE
jgi:hypothetical protein